MADMRTKGQLPGTCMDTCHGKLYIMIISGDGDTTELKRYDPLVNSWDPMEEHAEDTFCAERNSVSPHWPSMPPPPPHHL